MPCVRFEYMIDKFSFLQSFFLFSFIIIIFPRFVILPSVFVSNLKDWSDSVARLTFSFSRRIEVEWSETNRKVRT